MAQLYSKQQLREIFQSPFNQEAWKAILHNLFRAELIRKQAEKFTAEVDNEDGYYLGSLDTSDSYRIGLFYFVIKTGSVAHKKVGLRNLVKQFVNPTWGEFDAAIVVFNDKREWRLSFVCDIKDVKTAPKRYTFVFGEHDNFYRTAIERFLTIQNSEPTFENIRKAFSVDALSDDFFDTYREYYADFVQYITGKRYVKEGNKWVERELGKPNFQYTTTFDCDDKLVRDYVKKMFGRIVFLYFLQRKGWLNGDRQYMHNLFYESTAKDNFLDGVLEPLFFEVLNTDKQYRTADANALPGSENIPYLNGGLFARDEIDELDCVFPEDYFKKLFDFLDSYNFTIDENDVDDAEIGIDPEMLGRIFENLLEDNKDKGAFYTPKEIVNYMCRESLIAYLQNRAEDSLKPVIRNFVETCDASALTKEQCYELRKKLQDVKICDPAIGSGAFPMGLVNILSRLYIAMKADTDTSKMKRHIIENNIYGVDIEKGAVDIARLRFWLAMIVEEKEPMPLPNLHFKIMQGNSLLESINGIDLSDLTRTKRHNTALKQSNIFGETIVTPTQASLFDSSDAEREALKTSLSHYYTESNHTERDRLFNSIINNVRRQIFAKDESISQAGLDVSANDQFFLWHTWFADVFDNGGFDIVIGNPPYIQLQKAIGEKGVDRLGKEYDIKLGDLYEREHFESFAKTGDIYCLFYEQGWRILKQGGHLCFITSNKWMRAAYGELLRKFFVENVNTTLIIDFAGIQIFENATVDTNILLYAKEQNQFKTTCVSGNKGTKDILNKLSDFVQQQQTICDFTSSGSWVILSPIEQSIKRKIEAVGTPLKDWDINIYRGVLTGYNDAFIISTEKREEILANCQSEDERKKTAELIRPILRGRDIKRYGYEWADKYIIATFPSRHYDIEQYPAVKHHLLSFGKERLEQTGKTYTINGEKIKSRKKTNNKWFETQDSISYWEDFNKPKIVYPNMTKYMPFFYDENTFCTNQKCFIVTGQSMAYLTAFFNSSLFKFCFRESFPELQGGTREMSKIFFDKIPVLQVSAEMNAKFRLYVDDIQSEYTKPKAIAIDTMIFDLYNLSERERQVIGFVEIE